MPIYTEATGIPQTIAVQALNRLSLVESVQLHARYRCTKKDNKFWFSIEAIIVQGNGMTPKYCPRDEIL